MSFEIEWNMQELCIRPKKCPFNMNNFRQTPLMGRVRNTADASKNQTAKDMPDMPPPEQQPQPNPTQRRMTSRLDFLQVPERRNKKPTQRSTIRPKITEKRTEQTNNPPRKTGEKHAKEKESRREKDNRANTELDGQRHRPMAPRIIITEPEQKPCAENKSRENQSKKEQPQTPPYRR